MLKLTHVLSYFPGSSIYADVWDASMTSGIFWHDCVERVKLKVINRVTSGCVITLRQEFSDPPSTPVRLRDDESTCLSFILSALRESRWSPSTSSLPKKTRCSFVTMHSSLFWWGFFCFAQFNHVRPGVYKDAIQVMQKPCLNVLGQQSQGAESMAEVIL